MAKTSFTQFIMFACLIVLVQYSSWLSWWVGWTIGLSWINRDNMASHDGNNVGKILYPRWCLGSKYGRQIIDLKKKKWRRGRGCGFAVIITCAAVYIGDDDLWNVHVRRGRALKLCQISFHALQSTASEMVTFTWPAILPLVAPGPRLWLNLAQGPTNV